jgi:4-hydroxy-tetrahydrodipicolinate synthase
MLKIENALFHGAASEVVTPFHPNGKVAYELLEQEINYMIDKGVTGFFVNGLASEALMLSFEERMECAKIVITTVNGRVPIMGNIIANSLEEGITAARAYAGLGADAIIITPPLIYKYSPEGIFDFFNEIASSTPLPAYIYNAPETGNKLSPQQISKLLKANSNIIGCKDSTQNIIEQQTLLSLVEKGKHFELLAGSDAQIVSTMMLGGVGCISLITVVFPELIVETCKACENGEWEKAIDLQARVLRVREMLKIGPFMAAYKYVSNKLGRPMGGMKRPMAYVSSQDMQEIDAILSELGLL